VFPILKIFKTPFLVLVWFHSILAKSFVISYVQLQPPSPFPPLISVSHSISPSTIPFPNAILTSFSLDENATHTANASVLKLIASGRPLDILA